MVIWKSKRGRIYKINDTPNDQTIRVLQSATIRAIYDNDAQLSPKEQQDAIKLLPGLTAAEMEAVIPLTGPALADSIRAVIAAHRAHNRSVKDQHNPN